MRQQVIATLGRLGKICARAGNWSDCCGLARASPTRPSSSGAVADGEATTSPAPDDRGRPWCSSACGRRSAVARSSRALAGSRAAMIFSLERAAFLTVSALAWFSRRLGSRRRPLAAGLPDRGRRAPRPAPPLPRHGLARRRTRRDTAQAGATPCAAALLEGRHGGGAVSRGAARPLQHDRPGVHGHHQSLFRGRGWADARAAGLLQGPPAGPQPNDPGGAARRRRPAGMHRNVARKHRRRRQPDPRGRPVAQALFDQPGLRRRRSRHDQRGDDRGVGGPQAALHSGRARAQRQARARTRARRSRALRPVLSDQTQKGDRLRGQGGDARRAALHRLPQPRPDEEGRRRQGYDPGRARTGARRRATRRWSATRAIAAGSP